MNICKLQIKSRIFKHHKEMVSTLANGGHAGTVEDIMVKAIEDVLKMASELRAEREESIPSAEGLTEHVTDPDGLRRFSMKCIDDEPVMSPDIDGFWVPIHDVRRYKATG